MANGNSGRSPGVERVVAPDELEVPRERLEQIQERIRTGFYRSPDVALVIAARLIARGEV
jgi:hypothetical protein